MLYLSIIRRYSGTTIYGDWIVGELAGQGLYAATVNDSGAVLGEYCYPTQGECYWLLANDVSCINESPYTVLVNSDSGAASMELTCMSINGSSRFAFSDFDAIDKVVKASERIGIAFPLKNGQFQVSRFSLTGSSNAVLAMRSAAQSTQKTEAKSTKDLLL